MTQAEAWGAFALLCCVGAIVFGAVRFHRARASLRDASQARMNQWVAEMAAQAAAANAQPADEAVEGEAVEGEMGDARPVAVKAPSVLPNEDAAPFEHLTNSLAEVPADEPAEESLQAPVAEPVAEARPVDVRSEMDAFFGNGLPPTGR